MSETLVPRPKKPARATPLSVTKSTARVLGARGILPALVFTILPPLLVVGVIGALMWYFAILPTR